METETEAPKKQESTMMHEPTYNPETGMVSVVFKKGGSYSYPMTAEQFEQFHSAPSWGKFFHGNKTLFANGVKHSPVEATPPS